MHQGNWKCSGCGGTINELPFVPRSESGLTCRSCYAGSKNSSAPTDTSSSAQSSEELPPAPDEAGLANEPVPDDGFNESATTLSSEKAKFTGDWTCSGCNKAITTLPFAPRTTNNLKCLDCFKQSK